MKPLDRESFDSFLKCGSLIGFGEDQILVGWGKRQWFALPCPNAAVNFFAPDFFLKIGLPWFVHEYHAIISIKSLQSFIIPSDFKLSLDWQLNDFDNFKEQFDSLQSLIDEGCLSKGVPYTFAKTKVSSWQGLLIRMLSGVLTYIGNFPAHAYGFWDEEGGILGASPELLFDLGDTLTTMAVAGTSKDKDFLCSLKLDQEHQLVIEGICSALNDYGCIEVGETKRLDLKSLYHLATPIEVELKQKSGFYDLVKALHPTPALGAFPKKQGMKWLERCQTKLHRKRFGAPLGYLSGDKGRCLVAIRNVQWDHQGLMIGAGCGVVKASRMEEEWQEVELKIQATKDLLGL